MKAGESAPVDFSRQQTGALLAYLTLRCDRSHDREELVAIFWPDDDAESGRRKLRQSLYALRRQFAPHLDEAPELFVSTRDTVALNADAISTDVRDFEAAIRRAAACDEASERLQWLLQADDLYRGELLAGFYQEELIARRADLAARHLSVLHEATREWERLGDLNSAILTARRIVALDPLAEESHADLMRLQAAAGRPGEVRRQLRELERALASELGVKPAEATYALAERWSAEAEIPAPPAAPQNGESQAEPATHSPAEQRGRPGAGTRRRAIAVSTILVGVAIAAGFRVRSALMPRPPASKTPVLISLDMPEPRILWSKVIPLESGDNWSEPSGIAIDLQDNIYVTGFVNTKETDTDYLTQKISPDGELLWQRRYNGTGNDVDRARGVIVDLDGNAVVTGESDNGKGSGATRLAGLDIVTVKYDSAGNQKYAIRWNGASDGEDRPRKVTWDSRNHEAVVAGSSWSKTANGGRGGFQMACLRIGCDATDKTRPVAATFLGPSHLEATASDMTVSRDGDVTLVGTAATGAKVGPDSETLALQIDPKGRIPWIHSVGGRNTGGHGGPLVSGDVIASQALRTSPGGMTNDVEITRISPAGSALWSYAFSASGRADDWPAAIAGDYGGGVVVAGQYASPGGAEHVGLVAYDRFGNWQWASRFQSHSTGPDVVNQMLCRPDDLFIAGYTCKETDHGRSTVFSLLALRLRAHDGKPIWMSRSVPILGTGGNVPSASTICATVDGHRSMIVTCQVVVAGRNTIRVVKFAP